jgi:formylglycine-generating enzyme required for sulfatase activity
MNIHARSWVAAVALAGCAPVSPDPVAASPGSQDPEPTPVGNAGKQVDPPSLAEESADEEPEVPRLPDGTAIAACEDPAPGMACVAGGPFIRGADDGPTNARPAQTIHLQTFFMDIHEVTSAEYKACKKTGQCPRGGPLYNDFSRPKQPIVGINWYAAVKYCEAHGKHLPTEAQWEKAARGPDGVLHPWGNDTATCELAVIKDERGRSCGVKKKKEHPNKGRTFEVGSRPPGVYGLHDMMGNAWEWVYDWASPDYAACGDACGGVDPRGPCQGVDECPNHDQKVVRGGSWYWPASHATGIYRRTHYPENEISNFHHFGFRCAASVEQARSLRATAPSQSPG